MIESNASDDQVMLVLLASTDKRKKQMVYSHLILCVCGCPIKEFQLATQKKKGMSCLELTLKLGR